MIPNRNDEPDPMAATRASGGCLGTKLIFIKMYKNKIHRKQRVRGAAAPRVRAAGAAARAGGGPAFQAANFSFSLSLSLSCRLVLQGNMVPVIWLLFLPWQIKAMPGLLKLLLLGEKSHVGP